MRYMWCGFLFLVLSYSANAQSFKLYKTPAHAERYPHLAVINYSDSGPQPDRRCVMQVEVDDVRVGDVYMISGEFQVSNKLAYQVEITKRLTWESGSGGNGGYGYTEGFERITPETGYNVIPELWWDTYENFEINRNNTNKTEGAVYFAGMHHGVVSFTGSYVSTEIAEKRYICVVAYAGGSFFTREGDVLVIDQNYGHMSVLRIRGAEATISPKS